MLRPKGMNRRRWWQFPRATRVAIATAIAEMEEYPRCTPNDPAKALRTHGPAPTDCLEHFGSKQS